MTRTFRQLVVGVDFSPHSVKAVSQALRLQPDTRTGVTAVHVVDRNMVADLKDQPGFSEEIIRDQADQRLRKWLDGVAGPGHNIVAEAVVGILSRPWSMRPNATRPTCWCWDRAD